MDGIRPATSEPNDGGVPPIPIPNSAAAQFLPLLSLNADVLKSFGMRVPSNSMDSINPLFPYSMDGTKPLPPLMNPDLKDPTRVTYDNAALHMLDLDPSKARSSTVDQKPNESVVDVTKSMPQSTTTSHTMNPITIDVTKNLPNNIALETIKAISSTYALQQRGAIDAKGRSNPVFSGNWNHPTPSKTPTGFQEKKPELNDKPLVIEPIKMTDVEAGEKTPSESSESTKSKYDECKSFANPNHDSLLSQAIRDLHLKEFAHDVVLLGQGGVVGAHKTVLATASPLLKCLLLETQDHPAMISVTETPIDVLRNLISILYTGVIPNTASLHTLGEVACLLQMEDLAELLHKTFTDPTGALYPAKKPLSKPPVPELKPCSSGDLKSGEKPPKKGKANRLDQILFQKLNVPPPAFPDNRGILGELLSQTTPLSLSGLYQDFELKGTGTTPLNLTKAPKKPELGGMVSSDNSSSLSALNLANLSSLTGMTNAFNPLNPSALPMLGNHPLGPLTSTSFSSFLSQSAAMAASDEKARAFLQQQNKNRSSNKPSSLKKSLSKNTISIDRANNNKNTLSISINKSTSGSCSSNTPILNHIFTNSFMGSSAQSSNTVSITTNPVSITSAANDARRENNSMPISTADKHEDASPAKSSSANSHNLPLLCRLQSGPLTQDMMQEVYDQLKTNPQLSKFANFNALSGMGNLASTLNLPGFEAFPNFLSCMTDPALLQAQAEKMNKSLEEQQFGETAEGEALNLSCSTKPMSSLYGDPKKYGDKPPLTISPITNQSLIDAKGNILTPGAHMSSGDVTTSIYCNPQMSLASSSDKKHIDNNENKSMIVPMIPAGLSLSPSGLLIPDKLAQFAGQGTKIAPHITPQMTQQMGRKRKGCGDCAGCQVVDDCGQCRFCRDKAKFGGPNRLKQVCVYKRCALAESDLDDIKRRRKTTQASRKARARCGTCNGCQRTSDCTECYACLHNASSMPPGRKKICEMRVCEQQQMDEVMASLNSVGEPSPYSTDSITIEGASGSNPTTSGTSSPDGSNPNHNSKMKQMRKDLKKKLGQPYSRVRTKYYCGECPGCHTTTPCGLCLYCEDMPKFGGPGRYRQKCVKQLCIYHPRLQALKLSNRSKVSLEDHLHLPEGLLPHMLLKPGNNPPMPNAETHANAEMALKAYAAEYPQEFNNIIKDDEDSLLEDDKLEIDVETIKPDYDEEDSFTPQEIPFKEDAEDSNTSPGTSDQPIIVTSDSQADDSHVDPPELNFRPIHIKSFEHLKATTEKVASTEAPTSTHYPITMPRNESSPVPIEAQHEPEPEIIHEEPQITEEPPVDIPSQEEPIDVNGQDETSEQVVEPVQDLEEDDKNGEKDENDGNESDSSSAPSSPSPDLFPKSRTKPQSRANAGTIVGTSPTRTRTRRSSVTVTSPQKRGKRGRKRRGPKYQMETEEYSDYERERRLRSTSKRSDQDTEEPTEPQDIEKGDEYEFNPEYENSSIMGNNPQVENSNSVNTWNNIVERKSNSEPEPIGRVKKIKVKLNGPSSLGDQLTGEIISTDRDVNENLDTIGDRS